MKSWKGRCLERMKGTRADDLPWMGSTVLGGEHLHCPPCPCTQIGSYYGSEITSVDVDGDGLTDVLLVGAPMYFSEGRERGRVYMYILRQVPLWGPGQL